MGKRHAQKSASDAGGRSRQGRGSSRGKGAANGGRGSHGAHGARKAAGRGARGGGRVAAPEPPQPLTGDPHARIAIIGGGAAGLAAAVAAGRELAAAGLAGSAGVVVFEADERVGRSILATGNGRCNFSNRSASPGLYRNARFVADAMTALLARDSERAAADGRKRDAREDPVHGFFDRLGLLAREEGDGRLYPATGKASTVVDVLRAAAADLGVAEACGRRAVRVDAPESQGGLFHIRFADGSIEHAAAVVVAAGGKHAIGAAALLPQRYAAVPPRPVLGPLAVREHAPRTLDNIRVRAAVWLAAGSQNEARLAQVRLDPDLDPASWNAADEAERAWASEFGAADASCAPSPSQQAGVPCGSLKAHERGEVLFRSYGVSGICVFNLSRFAAPGDVLLIDLLPQVRAVDCEQMLRRRFNALAAARNRIASGASCASGADAASGPRPLTGEAFLRGMLLPAVAQAVCAQAEVDPSAALAKDDLARLARALKAFPLTVEGIGDARQCQVLSGGLSVDQFDPRTMESRLDAGLFAAGEALDVDAPCGGYNLHWAWASGMLAGASAARRVARPDAE